VSQTATYRAETMALLQDLRREVAGQLRITRDGQPLPIASLCAGDWQPMPGFTDDTGAPTFWQQLIGHANGISWVRTKGLAGTGHGQTMHIPQASVCYVVRGAMLWSANGAPMRRMKPGDSVYTPANGPHSWAFLTDTQCLVRIMPLL
jgi:uncharacterized cupin superfamily protein